MGEDKTRSPEKNTKTNVGASLLAMAACQTTVMLNVQPPSPAG
jgi:hypothetical protein